MKIRELIDGIRMKAIALPEFQREYVWRRDQAKKLMSSLLKEYPVGSLLFWKTNTPPELKNVDQKDKNKWLVNVILDGQQRLTTLYLLITGEIPPYYTENDIQNDPRSLYYNLETREFKYYQATIMKSNPVWVCVVDVMSGAQEPDVVDIAEKMIIEQDSGFKEMIKLLLENNQALSDIKKMELPELNVPSSANLNEAIDIFDLVNRQGTKLTDADLALTHITGHWSQARRVMKKKIEKLSQKQFKFSLNFMTRALTGVVAKRGLFEAIHSCLKEELTEGWETLKKILDYTVQLLPGTAYINSTDDVNTTNIFIPWVVYLSLHDGIFPNEKEMKQAIHWLYLANIWARYTGQTDQRLEHDISLVLRYDSPWDELRKAIIDQRGRIEIQASDLQGRAAQHPLYRMLYLIAKAHGAVDWFNGMSLAGAGGEYYSLHSHHIFPQSLLYKHGYNSENYLHKKIVNEIANRAFLTASTNLKISDSPPENYLSKVESKYPGALVHQFIPMKPELWKIENYENFLAARREMIALKMNEFLNAMITEPVEPKLRTIKELISLGESEALEFKSSLQWDVVHNQRNKGLRLSVIKTIAAFLNSEGGTLVIGVEDNGQIYGLSKDLKLTQNSTDKFLNLMNNIIDDLIGLEYSHFIRVRIEAINGNQVCVVDVDKSSFPAYVSSNKRQIFFIRSGTTTRDLDPEETVNYVNAHWAG